jgi:glycosyltransferase involved in cell wall biosynthesis
VLAARQVSDRIILVDSGSTDGTLELLDGVGCRVVYRRFENYSDQRNWAINEFRDLGGWQLHLDADEVLDNVAIKEIKRAVGDPREYNGFLLGRRTYFMGSPLRFGGTNSWHLRLFRSGAGSCENRLYDQHFLCDGEVQKIDGLLHDLNVGGLSEWTARHNRWSDMESLELCREDDVKSDTVNAKLSGDPRERRRLYKSVYYKCPILIRAVLYFIFRYFFQLGFLDGKVGFIYSFLQAFWFRVLVDAKLLESRR